MEGKTIFLLGLALLIVALAAFLVYYYWLQRKTGIETQSTLTDRDLLLKFVGQPDGFLTPQTLSEVTGLSKTEARNRLQALHLAGILDHAHNSRLASYYALRHPVADTSLMRLSPEPFLTVDDILTLFEQHGYRPRDQDLIISTGLPLRLIRRELKYFAEQGVVDTLYASDGYGKQSQRIYVLKEPYRSQPDHFRRRAETDDLQLRSILRNDNFIV